MGKLFTRLQAVASDNCFHKLKHIVEYTAVEQLARWLVVDNTDHGTVDLISAEC